MTVRARDGRGGTSTAGHRDDQCHGRRRGRQTTPLVADGDGGIKREPVQVSWDAPDNTGPAHHRLRLPLQGRSDVTERGRRSRTRRSPRLRSRSRWSGGEHAPTRCRCGRRTPRATSDWSDAGIGATERARREQPARVHRGRERDAERECKLAFGHAHRGAHHRDGRRFGRRTADLQPRRARRAVVRHQ